HVAAGGNATVRGNATIGKNLRVEGWLDARNIKGPSKGVYGTEAKLREAYPRPQAGWWALVGDSLPAELYLSIDGKWEGTGRQAGNPSVDMGPYNERLEEIFDMAQEAASVAGEAEASAKEALESAESLKESQDSETARLEEAISGKVDKEAGKGLSANDYTTAEKSAVATIGGKLDASDVGGISAEEIAALLSGLGVESWSGQSGLPAQAAIEG
ncbi:MAG: hypothetical protein NC548_49050, partial [Lachnospiraceae bacterium]|nr:hypothetical protein [Lachnospiraceae bacterium]